MARPVDAPHHAPAAATGTAWFAPRPKAASQRPGHVVPDGTGTGIGGAAGRRRGSGGALRAGPSYDAAPIGHGHLLRRAETAPTPIPALEPPADVVVADEEPPPYSSPSRSSGGPTTRSSILQPRVAVVLGVPREWHVWLFGARLLSLGPATVWGVQSALQLLLRLVLRLLLLRLFPVPGVDVLDGSEGVAGSSGGSSGSQGRISVGGSALVVDAGGSAGDPFPLTETSLAVIWVSFFASASPPSPWPPVDGPKRTMGTRRRQDRVSSRS